MSISLRIRSTVLLPLREQRDLLGCVTPQGTTGLVFVPGVFELPSGERVDLEVVFAKEQVTVRTRGVIRWKRVSGRKNLPAGVAVEILESEKRTYDFLMTLARGQAASLCRRPRRYPVVLDFDYQFNGRAERTTSADLSLDGAFILSGDPPPVGTVLESVLHLPGTVETLSIRAEVRWHRKDNPAGMGVKFIFPSPEAKLRLDALLADVKRQLAKGTGSTSSTGASPSGSNNSRNP